MSQFPNRRRGASRHSASTRGGFPDPRRESPRYGLARVLSKLGYCSRRQAASLIAEGRVRVNGTLRLKAEWPVDPGNDQIEVDGKDIRAAQKFYLMLNKPRGLVTTASDEQGRPTVFACLPRTVPHLSAVGRLDKASEGLLLFTNDSLWAATITDPAHQIEKIYHVQIDCVADASLLEKINNGVVAEGERLRVSRVAILRHGQRHSWLEIALHEGKNRHIRRLLEALGCRVLRLVRIAIGPLQLGNLAKGQSRLLNNDEVAALAVGTGPPKAHR